MANIVQVDNTANNHSVSAGATVTGGTILARIRNGSGYALTDDYFDVARYIGSSPMPMDWVIDPTDSVFIDFYEVALAIHPEPGEAPRVVVTLDRDGDGRDHNRQSHQFEFPVTSADLQAFSEQWAALADLAWRAG